ncbi:MAG: 6,7-dimethyl-8-ribityllumazine synthase [Gemmatimonadetes bacterium]|nr:6,7-dimethyl-8-ribityllumazine synthase [Gemmatimonadota bacterium]MBP6670507.1 6,7-dimethyl-8-ribityllumazine synthase [Gemmatimonadales bacterium]MBK7348873.1 6,7-dimethyl-8-ribityllumazine synthase [Gemmatimonadota bacterium]MBK7714436.1 6,7-dimethyl-8-ribityllumazine synthase [Gemmatimonadota bacterium]MBK7783503.1 6,7-dimethyl-8-ribityllumazine synthase [Gemmatimonadota bacterium]
MPEIRGQLRAHGRLAILVSQYNERVTARLLEGALECCRAAGMSPDAVDIVWLPGAFELGAAAAAAAGTGRYTAIVALGAVVRGETAHFEFVAGEAARGLSAVAVRHGLPVAFGVLTTETMEQALARAGGAAGNKGYEATEAALRTADALIQLKGS